MMELQYIAGQLAMTNNAEVCLMYLNQGNSKIITLADKGTGDMRLSPNLNPNIIDGLVLTPPLEAYWAEVDNNREAFEQIYANHLTTTASDYLAVILKSLHMGINMILYYPGDMLDAVPSFIISYMNMVYGIWIATERNDYMVNNNYLPFWVQTLYNKGLIDELEFVRTMPTPLLQQLPQEFLDVLMMGLKIPGNTLEQQRYYMREYCNTPQLDIPFGRVD